MTKSEAMEWIEWIDGCEMQDMRHAGRRMYTVSICHQTFCMERTLWYTDEKHNVTLRLTVSWTTAIEVRTRYVLGYWLFLSC